MPPPIWFSHVFVLARRETSSLRGEKLRLCEARNFVFARRAAPKQSRLYLRKQPGEIKIVLNSRWRETARTRVCVDAGECAHSMVSEARAIASAQTRTYDLRACALAIARASEATLLGMTFSNFAPGTGQDDKNCNNHHSLICKDTYHSPTRVRFLK